MTDQLPPDRGPTQAPLLQRIQDALDAYNAPTGLIPADHLAALLSEVLERYVALPGDSPVLDRPPPPADTGELYAVLMGAAAVLEALNGGQSPTGAIYHAGSMPRELRSLADQLIVTTTAELESEPRPGDEFRDLIGTGLDAMARDITRFGAWLRRTLENQR